MNIVISSTACKISASTRPRYHPNITGISHKYRHISTWYIISIIRASSEHRRQGRCLSSPRDGVFHRVSPALRGSFHGDESPERIIPPRLLLLLAADSWRTLASLAINPFHPLYSLRGRYGFRQVKLSTPVNGRFFLPNAELRDDVSNWIVSTTIVIPGCFVPLLCFFRVFVASRCYFPFRFWRVLGF